jgi:hypothetical protein
VDQAVSSVRIGDAVGRVPCVGAQSPSRGT